MPTARTTKAPTARTTKAKSAPKTVEVTFRLPAEVEADSVALCGDFNSWSTDSIFLEPDGDSCWTASVALQPGQTYRFRFLCDGERWENAWQADAYVPNPFGSDDSVVVVG